MSTKKKNSPRETACLACGCPIEPGDISFRDGTSIDLCAHDYENLKGIISYALDYEPPYLRREIEKIAEQIRNLAKENRRLHAEIRKPAMPVADALREALRMVEEGTGEGDPVDDISREDDL